MATHNGTGNAPSPDAMEFPGTGFRIGEYVIETMLGHGSMSTVFLAKDTTGHEVALKVFQEGPNVSEVMRERFRREVEASKTLRNHPNIMTVYATGKDGPFHYIAMQRIMENKTLENLIDGEILDIPRVVNLFIKIARALAYAHERKVMHRDVKPSNIMIDRFEEPLLADFGVAILLEWPRFTVAGALTGTPLYMSPEQANSQLMDRTSDLYSLGVVLYETLTGVLPYSAHRMSSLQETLRAVQTETVRRPRLFRDEISPELEAVILKVLSRDPTERYQDGNALADDLQHALNGEAVDAPLYSRSTSLFRRLRRHRRDMFMALSLVAVLFGITLYFLGQLREMQYQALAGMARLQNSEYKLEQLSKSSATPLSSALALERLHMARDYMENDEWADAATLLDTVIDQSRRDGDAPREILALLERARCATMLGEDMGAFESYGRILSHRTAALSIAGLAQLEAALLAIRRENPAARQSVLSARTIPATIPVYGPLRMVGGDPAELDQVIEDIGRLPAYLHNDTYFTAAIMSQSRGDREAARDFLRRCIATSLPENEWPAPLARRLAEEPAP